MIRYGYLPMLGWLFITQIDKYYIERALPRYMYVLYLDESGDYANWSENNSFVLSGVAIHEGQIGTLSRALI